MVAGSLEIELLANIARLQQGMNEAKGLVASSMSSISKSVETAKGVLASLGVGISAGMLAGLVRATIDAADHLNDLSKSTGLAVEELSGLRLVARQGGTDLDSLAKGLQKVSVEIGKDPGKFKELGITAKDGIGQLKQLSDLFNLLPDINQRNALAQKIFGKSWAEMAPILSEGSQKLQETIDKGAKLAGVTKEMAAEADAFNDKLAELSGTGGMLNRMVAPLLPLLNLLADELLDIQKNSDTADTGFSVLAETMRAIIVLGGNVAFVLKGIGNDLGAMAAQLAALGRGDFAGFMEIGRAATEDAEKARLAFDRWEKKILDVGKAAKLSGAEVSSEIQRLAARARAADPVAQAAAAAEAAASRAAAARAKNFLDDGKGEGSMKAILDARNALAKASAEQFQQIEMNTLEVFIQANERAFKSGAKDMESYYAERSRLQLAEIEVKERALIAEMSAAKVLATSAVKEEDKIKAQAKVVEITTKLIALGKDRMKVDGPDEAAVRAWERISKVAADFDQQTASINGQLYTQQKSLKDGVEEAELRARYANETNGAYKEEIALIALRYKRERDVLEVKLAQSTLREEEKQALRDILADDAAMKVAEANRRAAKEASEAWRQVGDSFVDNLMQGGKSVAQYLKDLFRTLVLRPILSPVGQAGAAAIGAFPSTANAGSGLLGNIGSAFNMASTLGTFSGGLSAGFGGLTGSIGSLFGAAGTGTTLGGSISAGMTALGAGNIAGGLGTLVGALGPLALGVAALTTFLGKQGETRSGGTYSGLNFVEGPSGGEIGGEAVRQAISGTMTSINQTLKSLGSSATLSGFLSGLESSENGKGFAFAGGSLSTGANFGAYNRTLGIEVNRGSMTQEQANAAYALELKRAAAGAIAASDAVGPLADAVRALGEISQATGEAIDTVLNRISKALTERAALEERLFMASATELQVLTRARDAERASIDETNRALLEQVYAAEDARKASEAAALAEKEAADAAARAAEDAARAIKDLADTQRSDLINAYEREQDAVTAVMNRHQGYVDSLKRFAAQLSGGQFAMLSPEAAYRSTGAEFSRIAALASSGDEAALEQFQGAAEAFLQASAQYNASSGMYFVDLAAVKGATEAAEQHAQATVDVQRSILNANTQSMNLLGLLNSTTQLGFNALLAAYMAANGGTAPIPAPGTGTVSGGITTNAGTYLDPGFLSETISYFQDAASLVGLYQDLLGRTPDAGAYDYYAGMSAAQITAAIQASNEYANLPGHASGLWNVPYDNYAMRAHQGEMVLTRSQADDYRSGNSDELGKKIDRLTSVVASYAQRDLNQGAAIERNTGAAADKAVLASVMAVPA